MKMANCPGLVDSALAETIPMQGRMIHGRKDGALFEESQAYDIHGRARKVYDCPIWMLTHLSSYGR